MRSIAFRCLRCKLPWIDFGRFERRCPFCRSSQIAPSEETR